MTHEAYFAMLNYIGSRHAETGGILFGYEDDFVIRKFIPDAFASTTKSSYTMNTDFINKKIRELWENEKLSLLGIVHSHPNGHKSLSFPDRKYFSDLMTYIGLDTFYTPIINTMADGQLDCLPYAFEKNSDKPIPTNLYLIQGDSNGLDEVTHSNEEKDHSVSVTNFYVIQSKEKGVTIYTISLINLLLSVLLYGSAFYMLRSVLLLLIF